jgi:hypothetical protein
MSVLITRLITGQEILGEVTIKDDSFCSITNPTEIAASRNQSTGNVDIHMGPFTPLASEKTITISLKNVLCQYEPVVEIINKYNKMFGSGIIIPENTGIAIP